MPDPDAPVLHLEVDGEAVTVPDDGASLLEVLRDRLGRRGPKDGCSPQGQCGCCTVLVDGAPRVACVTPARRVAGRSVTTLDGLEPEVLDAWAGALTACGGSQCGFCTPGIVVRLEAHHRRGADLASRAVVDRALAGHLCRCTGWQTIAEAAARRTTGPVDDGFAGRDPVAASARATLEGGAPQRVGAEAALGQGGFADDGAPDGALVAVPDGAGGWVVAETLTEARRLAGKVQGRRTTEPARPPIDAPPGEWAAVLRTCWVDPGYLETDASWCEPGGEPASVLANGGAFGAKRASPLPEVARRLATEHGRPVRALWSREDVVREGPKRPPVAGGARPDGTGSLRVARTTGVEAVVASVAPGLVVELVDLAGPPTSVDLRGAAWVEAVALLAGAAEPGTAPSPAVRVDADGAVHVTAPDGGQAVASIGADGAVSVVVDAGEPLDEVVLRSYVVGAAHQALSWIAGESISVADDGTVLDLTVRSLGVLRPADTPPVHVEVRPGSGPPVPASSAALAAVAAAAWRARGCPATWPAGA